jgi:hypothetical protein
MYLTQAKQEPPLLISLFCSIHITYIKGSDQYPLHYGSESIDLPYNSLSVFLQPYVIFLVMFYNLDFILNKNVASFITSVI